jgi:ribosome biogenesis protein ENP2
MSSMKVASYNNVKVYNLTSNKTAPQWLSESQKRKLAKDEDYRKRLELIQDFEMKTASQSIKMTPDKEHILLLLNVIQYLIYH